MKNLLALLLLVAFVYSLPINCSSGLDARVLEEEDIEEAGELFISRLLRQAEQIKNYRLNEECKKKNVCYVRCSDIIPTCQQTVFFSDFTANAQGTEEEVFHAYMDACIHRKYDKPTDPFPIKQFMLKSITPIRHLFTTLLESKLSYGDVLKKANQSNDLILMYLARMSELMLTFQRMCLEDPHWSDNVAQKVNELFDLDTTEIEVQFKGNEALKNYFIKEVKDLNAIAGQIVLSGSFGVFGNTVAKDRLARFRKAVTDFKAFFIDLIKKQDYGYVCSCQNFMAANAKLFPNGRELATKRCEAVCKTQHKTAVEEFIYEE